MNTISPRVALCLAAALFASFASAAPAAAQGSLAETLSWLREQIGAVKYHDGLNWDWTFELTESRQPCTLVYRSVRTRPATPKSRRIESVETVEMGALEDEVRTAPWDTRGVKLFSVHLRAKPDAVLLETWLTESREPDSRKNFILVRSRSRNWPSARPGPSNTPSRSARPASSLGTRGG